MRSPTSTLSATPMRKMPLTRGSVLKGPRFGGSSRESVTTVPHSSPATPPCTRPLPSVLAVCIEPTVTQAGPTRATASTSKSLRMGFLLELRDSLAQRFFDRRLRLLRVVEHHHDALSLRHHAVPLADRLVEHRKRGGADLRHPRLRGDAVGEGHRLAKVDGGARENRPRR